MPKDQMEEMHRARYEEQGHREAMPSRAILLSEEVNALTKPEALQS